MKGRPNPVLFGLLGVLVVVGAYLLLWKPRADDIADARTARDDARRELAVLNATRTGTTTTTDPAVNNALRAAVPATPALPDLLRQFKTVGADLGVEVEVITPAPLSALPNNTGGVVAVSVSGSGEAASVNSYISRLGALSRLFVIDKITLASAPASGAGPDASATPAVGTVEISLSGRVFTTAIPDQTSANGTTATTAAAAPTTTTVAAATPAPSPPPTATAANG